MNVSTLTRAHEMATGVVAIASSFRDNQELCDEVEGVVESDGEVWTTAGLSSQCRATLDLSAVSTTEGLPLCRSHTVRRVLTEDESRPRQPRTLTAIALEEW